MKTLLLWLVPPCIGALIGYVTNALAIKMLFRPLHEVRLLSRRLPFTPGILPRQRRELALSIGRMVERELLTPAIVRQRLAKDDVRLGIKSGVSAFTQKMLSTPLSSFSTAENGALSAALPALLRGFLASPAFEALFDSVFSALAEKIENGGGQAAFLNKSIRDIIGDESVEKTKAALERAIAERLRSDSGHIAEQAARLLDGAFPQIKSLLIRFLNRADVHEQLEKQGRVFLSGALLKLSAFQRFFLSAGQYDRTLSEKMPEIIDDLVRQLEALLQEPDTRQKLLLLFTHSADIFLSGPETGARSARIILDFIFTYADRPLRDLLQNSSFLKADNLKTLGRKISALIKAAALNSTQGKAGGRGFFTVLLESHGGLTLAALFSLTGENDKKDALDSFLTERLLSIADQQIGGALQSINVQALVSDRIDELDMIQVEHIILDIMANQLKWINVFGAILGAFIGIFQSLFSSLMR